MRLTLWPQSLFGRLIAATVLGVLLAQGVTLYLLARNGQQIFVQATTRMWAQRITGLTLLLDRLPVARRTEALRQLQDRPMAFGPLGAAGPPGAVRARGMWFGARTGFRRCVDATGACAARSLGAAGRFLVRRWSARRLRLPLHIMLRLPFRTDEDRLLAKHLRTDLGKGFRIEVKPAAAPAAEVIQIPAPLFQSALGPGRFYDVAVRSAAHAPLVFRVVRLSPEIPLPPSLILNQVLLVMVLVVALYVATRGITRPLSRLARAAEAIGQGGRAAQLEEKGARELRHAARAFNTMQDRLHRYLDSRTRVLAAMSHDLKTPLTRLRLQVETLIEDAALRARLGRELDEMESMVHGALALFRGLNEREASEPVDVNALLESVREGFAAMGEEVTVSGRALAPFSARPQALKRCLTNLVANAVKFGGRADIVIEDGEALRIRVRDEGPGVPPDELERVFEPFYRLECSRNRDTGGTGLGLSIARDVAQAHGGRLVLRNRPEGGLEAELRLPRR